MNISVKELPLSVVVAALIFQGRILLVRRVKGDYIGLWGLPGGKVEKDEHLSQAATREIFEESGIRAEFKGFLGLVSELLVEKGKVIQHFLLHVCELVPESTDIKSNAEGKLDWFRLGELDEMRDKVIPSDYLMIKKIIRRRESVYYNCILEKVGDRYELRKFGDEA